MIKVKLASNFINKLLEELDLVVGNGLDGKDLGLLRTSINAEMNNNDIPFTRYSSTNQTIVDYALIDKRLLEYVE